MEIKADYVHVPDGTGDNGPGAVEFTVQVAVSGPVRLRLEIQATDTNKDSAYIWFDDQPKYTWHAGRHAHWQYLAVDHDFILDVGRHTLHIGNRDDGFKLRALRILGPYGSGSGRGSEDTIFHGGVRRKVIYTGQERKDHNKGTITVTPNRPYMAKYEVLRSDLGDSDEKVKEVTLDGQNIGGCQPPGGDYLCDFWQCPSPLNDRVITSGSGTIAVDMVYQGQSYDCDCRKDATPANWKCKKQGSNSNYPTKVSAAGRFTLSPLGKSTHTTLQLCCLNTTYLSLIVTRMVPCCMPILVLRMVPATIICMHWSDLSLYSLTDWLLSVVSDGRCLLYRRAKPKSEDP
jgi:hypothetical protein